ncbi:MAG: hypothetical protein BHK79_07105 [Halanaerobium sp. MDAL1]|nr:MAG: hypothetical protein BHK79_07105 [Halanaerobium sp. MDAL1]
MDWFNIIPTLLGTLTGGFITWIVTNKSLRKQFKFEIKMKEKQFEFEMNSKELNELKIILKALNAIKREINHNILQANSFKKIMDKDEFKDKKTIDLNEFNNKSVNLSNLNWIKFNHELVERDLNLKINEIEEFYHNISFEVNNNIISRKRLEKIIEEGVKCRKKLDKNIEFIKEKIGKLEDRIK